jgi:putative redox protein
MKLAMSWQGKMRFSATDGNKIVEMDTQAPVGDGSALSPKQLLLAAVCGCSAMDVAGLLRKNKQTVDSFHIEADAPVTEGYPAIFSLIQLDYFLQGTIDREQAIEAVRLSQTKYCGVSAMVAKACPIRYRIHLNGHQIGEGRASFSI